MPKPFKGKCFSTNGVGQLESNRLRKIMKQDPYLKSYVKINLKWIKDKNTYAKIIIFLDENIGKKFPIFNF